MATRETDKTLSKVHPTKEPIFVLRGRDVFSPVIVEEWIRLAKASGVCSPEKVDSAQLVAEQMRRYSNRRLPD